MAKAYKNEKHELDTLNSRHAFSNTHPLKHETTYQLGIIFVIFNFHAFLTKLNKVLIQNCKTPSLYCIQGLYVVQNHHLHKPLNGLKNGFCGTFYFIYTFYVLLTKKLILMNYHFENWIEKSCSPRGRKLLVATYIKDIKPSITEVAISTFLNMFFYYSTNDEFVTSIQEVGRIIGYQKTQTGEILRELENLNFIVKKRKYFDNNSSLVLQLTNIEPLSNFLRNRPLRFLATYVKTEELHTRSRVRKVAVFKDVHDVDNIITIRTDRISYNDKNSDFLKKLNHGDVISYTPSVHRPTIKGIKHPLNLKIHTHGESQ